MKFRRIIVGEILFLCLSYGFGFDGCPPISQDPNDYIEDPNILENGLFECGDLYKETPYRTDYIFEPPLFWDRDWSYDDDSEYPDPNDCYVALRSDFYPPFPPNTPLGQSIEWFITCPYEGELFVLLSTGHPENPYPQDDSSQAIKAAMISQKVFLETGDTIKGEYFFGTTDYVDEGDNFNDVAEIWLESIDSNNEPNIVLAYCDVNEVGDYSSTLALYPDTNGWVSFSHTVEPNQVGYYNLRLKVKDAGLDSIHDSFLAADNLIICRGGVPLSDLNRDCKVDLVDLSIFSEAWLVDCKQVSDPESPLYDPDVSCYKADINESRFYEPNDIWVDLNDFSIMSSEWLVNPPTQ